MTITIEKLKELCDDYDSYYGSWPESKYEGESIFLFVMKNMGFDEEVVEAKEEHF